MNAIIDYREPSGPGKVNEGGLVGIRLKPETAEESQLMELVEKAGELTITRIYGAAGRYHFLIAPKSKPL